MLSRRRFLGVSSLGVVSLSAGCLPQSAVRADVATGSLQRLGQLSRLKSRLLGYPINMNTPPEEFFAWRKELTSAGIGRFAFNNVGNPFNPSPIPYNTHDFERDTILSFGMLYDFPANDTWGFLSNSGTDSNMHGMYMARTLLTGRTGHQPKAYFTREAHYSVQILRDLLGLETVFVSTLPDGGMDPDDLGKKLKQNSGTPALVVATVGTTFKGAVDNVERIRHTLRGIPSFLHLDAALFGGYLPYTRHAGVVSFQMDDESTSGRYDSIAVSCHKFFGFPAPAGLFITRESLYEEFNEFFSRIHNPEYIHQVPGTITCSRDAVKPAEFYYFSKPSAVERQAEDAALMLQNTDFLIDQLQTNFPELAAVRSNPMSNTVYFRSPGRRIVKKYSLATMHLETPSGPEEFAHAIVMPHVTRNVLTEFLTDLEAARP